MQGERCSCTLPWSVPLHPSSTVPEAKNDPVLRRYALRRLRLPLGSSTVPLVVPDASDWIRRGQWAPATLRGAEPPYWVQVWPASVAAARVLWRHGALAGRGVLDLGCGLGVPGAAAVLAGARVTFADQERDALAFAAWNATRLGAKDRVAVAALDWSRETIAGTFDAVVLADVSYRPLHHASLRHQLASCLAPGGVILHADPHRREATPFVQWLGEQFTCLTVSRATSFLDKRADIRLCVASESAETLASWHRALGLEPADAAHEPGTANSPPP